MWWLVPCGVSLARARRRSSKKQRTEESSKGQRKRMAVHRQDQKGIGDGDGPVTAAVLRQQPRLRKRGTEVTETVMAQHSDGAALRVAFPPPRVTAGPASAAMYGAWSTRPMG